MKGDEDLIGTLKTAMPSPIQKKELPKYKCFNRYFSPSNKQDSHSINGHFSLHPLLYMFSSMTSIIFVCK